MDTTLAISGGFSPCAPPHSLEEYLSPFLAVQTAQKTRTDYASELRLFGRWIGKRMEDIGPLDLISYRQHLEAKGLRTITIYKKLSVLRSFFAFFSQTFNRPNPALPLRLPKITDESSKAVLSLQEAMRLLSVINPSTTLGKRDRAIVGLMLVCGLRSCEVSRANIGDIHEIEGYKVLKVHGKGNKLADCKLREDVYAAVQAYLAIRGEAKADDPLFLSIGNFARGRICTQAVQLRVRQYFKLAGIERENLGSHSLRHTCATLCLSVGKADLLQVQRLLRHASPTTTQRYLRTLDWLKDNAVDLNPVSLPPVEG